MVITGNRPSNDGSVNVGRVGSAGSLRNGMLRDGGNGIDGSVNVGRVGRVGSVNLKPPPPKPNDGIVNVGSAGSAGSLGNGKPRAGGNGIAGSSGSGILTSF